jgi:DNA invertase Pin-like site-specific DNA recombinase
MQNTEAKDSVAQHVAIIYCRVSTDRQEENYSLDTQEEECRDYCAAESLTVAAVLREVGSAADIDRPIFQDALDYLRRGEAGVFVVHKYDRFMRNQDGQILALSEIRQGLGARAVSVQERLGDSLEDKLLEGIYAYVSAKERQHIRERMQGGRKARAQRDGLPLPGPTAPYGYRWVYETRADGRQRKTRLEENPATAPIVRRIFHEVASGATAGAVARGLTADGIPTPSQARSQAGSEKSKPIATEWGRNSLHKMLTNPYYAGAAVAYRWQAVTHKKRSEQTGRVVTKRSQRKREEPGVPLPAENVPALVSAEEWQAVQAQLARNKIEAANNTRYPASQLLRGGVAVCAYCGRRMHVKHLSPNPQRREIGAYVCAARYDWPASRCEGGSPSVAVNILDADIWDKVATVLTTHAVSLALMLREADPSGQSLAGQHLTRDIATHDGLIAEQEKRLKNLLRMQIDASDDETYAFAKSQADEVRARLARFRAQREDLAAQREDLAATARIAEHLLSRLPGGSEVRLPLPPTCESLEDEIIQCWARLARGEGTQADEEAMRAHSDAYHANVAAYTWANWSLDEKRAMLRWLGVRVEVYRGNEPQPPDGKHWRVVLTLDGPLADLDGALLSGSTPAIPGVHYRSP